MAGTKRTNTGSEKGKSTKDQSPGYLLFKAQQLKGRKKKVAEILAEWNAMDEAEKEKFEISASEGHSQNVGDAERDVNLRSVSHESGKTEGEASIQPEITDEITPGFIEKDVVRFHQEKHQEVSSSLPNLNPVSTMSESVQALLKPNPVEDTDIGFIERDVIKEHQAGREEEKAASQGKTRGRKPTIQKETHPSTEEAGEKRQRVTRQRSINI